jgi:fructuronate reductase
MDDENYRLAARALMLQEQAPTLKVKVLIYSVMPIC